MGLSDRLKAKVVDAATKTVAVAADQAGKAVDKAKDVIDERSDGAGPRLLALLRMDNDRPITIEALTVLLVDAVRKDDEARELSDEDVYKAAKRRYRRLGTVSLPTGPVGWYLVSLYCEAATLCDVVALRDEPLSDEQVAAHLLVLWGAMPDVASADGAIGGDGPSVAAVLVARARQSAEARLPETMTKKGVVLALWKSRGALDDAREAVTPSLRENVFPGRRVKGFIADAHAQLGEPPVTAPSSGTP